MGSTAALSALALLACACSSTSGAGPDLSDAGDFDLALPGCSPPPSGILFVDPQTFTAGAGSADCPFKVLDEALKAASSGTTVIVRGGASIVAVGDRAVPAGVILTGGTQPSPAPGPFVACDAASCAEASRWPLLLTDGMHAGFNLGAGSALRFFTLRGPGPDVSVVGAAGVSITGANVELDHLSISGCINGVNVEQGGTVELDDGVDASGNANGLVAKAGAGASILGAGSFDRNTQHGIFVMGGALAFTLRGAVSASSNGAVGLRFAALAAGSMLDGLTAHDNTTDGLQILTNSAVVVRNAQLHDNLGSGVMILAAGGANKLALIDLGSSNGAAAGHNRIYGNAGAGVCIPSPSPGPLAGLLEAEGNDFTGATGAPSKDCASVAATLSRGAACSGGVDVSDGSSGLIDIAPCN